jgi:hypothetical protein
VAWRSVCCGVAIRILPNGTIEFDTIEEHLAYVQALRARRKAPAPTHAGAVTDDGAPLPGTWEALMVELSGDGRVNAQKTLALIKNAGPGGIARAQLISALGTTPNGLGGILGGVTKACQRAGLTTGEGHLPATVIGIQNGVYTAGSLLQSNQPTW